MISGKRDRLGVAATVLASAVLAIAALAPAVQEASGQAAPAAPACGDNGGITLSPGFCATVFADKLGHARHLVVAPNGVVYVNTWSGSYYHNDRPPAGGFLVALQDTTGDGRADRVQRFGQSAADGAAGGTGIAFYNGAVYAEEKDRILRYPLPTGAVVPNGPPEVVVSGLPLGGDHPMHPFVIDGRGNLYVDLGSATNACQAQNRMPGSAGDQPCSELETRAGIWRYDANQTGQRFSPAERYATGLRNGEGMSFDSAGRLYATQHGRDQLSQNWPRLYSVEQGAQLPAEEVVELRQGADYGWPECYFDGVRNKLILAPEYGGDGKQVGVCAEKQGPVAVFPAHWAPNDLLIYDAGQFPTPYRGGAFIAFHGSWNRAPEPQGGYNVVFQPMADGKANGNYLVFADGFAGAAKEPGRAAARPSGLAVGPDGALYIADDVHGKIWRVTYKRGAAVSAVAPAPAPRQPAQRGSAAAQPPEGTHAGAGRIEARRLPRPPGSTYEQVELGDEVFHGLVAGGTCSGCHGSDAAGTSVGPDLTTGRWLWGDGSLKSITEAIANGVPHPKQYSGAMPPKGGAPLSKRDLAAVSAYVWAIGHVGGTSRQSRNENSGK